MNAFYVLLLATSSTLAVPPVVDFNRDVRPILSENCFYCHGQDSNQRQADLRLDVRDAAVASGAIIPNDAAESELIRRVTSDDPQEQMPPPNSNRSLTIDQKNVLARWIAQGAEYKPHWAFVAPLRPQLPQVKQTDWIRSPIDYFVLAKLESEGLSPSAEADRPTLIKRLSVDLTGLPPTTQEVDAFVADKDPRAYENLVDRLLASRHFGERMALEWLDVARYADSNGFQQDGDTWQWIWRDWVIKAFNADLPFDKFTTWQLAGDLLPNATTDQKIASAFNRNHLLNGEGGAIPEEQRFVNLFDRVDTTATTWLGLTMACAQCHDHKYDPITQRDYYSLLDVFNRVPETGVPEQFSARIRVAPPILEIPSDQNKSAIAGFEAEIAEAVAQEKIAFDAFYASWRSQVDFDVERNSARLSTIPQKPEEEWSSNERRLVDAELLKYFEENVWPARARQLSQTTYLTTLRQKLKEYLGDQIPRVMVMSDAQPRQTHILCRGDYLQPTEIVSFQVPAALPPLPIDAPRNRLGLAEWLTSAENPLTARVQVNRLWQHFWGIGLVKSAEDFGVQSEYPVHRNLLDWLAVEYRESGWSTKALIRLIVTSNTYRQSSHVTEELRVRDPENRLLARASRFRMPSFILRDWALAAAGMLDLRIGGPPVYPYQPDAIWDSLAITKERDFAYPTSKGPDLNRRSIYTFWRRTVGPANMFDTSSRQTCRVRLPTTNTPLHALTTLNDPTWIEASRVLAELTMKSSKRIDDRVKFAFRRVMSRDPTAQENEALRRAYNSQLSIYRAVPETADQFLLVGQTKRDTSLDSCEHAALSATCLAIFNLDEALTRE